jgi:hypothetical protein
MPKVHHELGLQRRFCGYLANIFQFLLPTVSCTLHQVYDIHYQRQKTESYVEERIN